MQKEMISWQEIKDGDKDSLSGIFVDLYDDLFHFAKRFEKNEDAIKDLIQELFLKLWKNRKSLVVKGTLKAYLFNSLRNIWNNKYQTEKRNRESNLLLKEHFIFQSIDFKTDNEITENQKNKLLTELNQLPEKQREAIYLKYFQGFDIEEISDILNMNRQSVRNNLYRAMTKLREKMLLQVFLSLV
jgi:RNA polymerase sigma factor (sigma-70 family)